MTESNTSISAETTKARRHPLAGKRLWLGLVTLVTLLGGAAVVAGSFVGDEPPIHWVAVAFAASGLVILIAAAATPGWGGVAGAVLQGAALCIAADLIVFDAAEMLAPTMEVVGYALIVVGVGGALSMFGGISRRGWLLPLYAGVAAAACGYWLIEFEPPMPWAPFVAIGAVLIIYGFCVNGLAGAARRSTA